MKPYAPPALTEFGLVVAATADLRNDSTDDTFLSLTGPVPGVGGSADTCVTEDGVTCL